jgi:hypothetical protein
MNDPLTEHDKTTLLGVARQALEAAVQYSPLPRLELSGLTLRLQKPGASFVTLSSSGVLRGCIGTIKHDRPLALDVQFHAQAAARDDYRFAPVLPEELPQIDIEISVLNQPHPLRYKNSQDLLQKLKPGVDGVILMHGVHRGTFLPQVWKRVTCPEQFLDLLCQKACLPPTAWRDQPLEILTYQVESFDEGMMTEASSAQMRSLRDAESSTKPSSVNS